MFGPAAFLFLPAEEMFHRVQLFEHERKLNNENTERHQQQRLGFMAHCPMLPFFGAVGGVTFSVKFTLVALPEISESGSVESFRFCA